MLGQQLLLQQSGDPDGTLRYHPPLTGFMFSAPAGWPSHVKPDPMLTSIVQVNLWLPRDMEGAGGLVVGRYPGVNGFGGLVCAQPLRSFLQARWKGLEAPSGTEQDDMHALMPGRCWVAHDSLIRSES